MHYQLSRGVLPGYQEPVPSADVVTCLNDLSEIWNYRTDTSGFDVATSNSITNQNLAGGYRGGGAIFDNPGIPKNSKIAYAAVSGSSVTGAPTVNPEKIEFAWEANDSPAIPTSYAEATSKTLTTAIQVDPTEASHITLRGDIAGILQEVVDRPGYTPQNRLVFDVNGSTLPNTGIPSVLIGNNPNAPFTTPMCLTVYYTSPDRTVFDSYIDGSVTSTYRTFSSFIGSPSGNSVGITNWSGDDDDPPSVGKATARFTGVDLTDPAITHLRSTLIVGSSVTDASSYATGLRIYGVDEDSPADPTSIATMESLARTTAFTELNTGTSIASSTLLKSYDVTAIVDEVLSRPLYDGSALMFILLSDLDADTAASFNPAGSSFPYVRPQLIVEYISNEFLAIPKAITPSP